MLPRDASFHQSTEGDSFQHTPPDDARQAAPELQVPVQESRCQSISFVSRHHLPRIDNDGSRYTGSRDAPGQCCVYISPGDQFQETYRLSTFSKFPQNASVQINDLARAGFYYTGYKDRAKCCSCGMAAENWMIGDDVFDSQWHATGCAFVHGLENRNVPTASTQLHMLRQQVFGQRTPMQGISHRNSKHRNYDPPISRIPAHGANAPMNAADGTTYTRGVHLDDRLPNMILANVVDREHENALRRLDLKRESDRRKTFGKWPTYPVPHLASSLARDGFFYLGNLDRVQCFSCSGVLRNWAPNDDVRDQHRRHFSQCRFILGTDPRNVEMNATQRREADEVDERIASLLQSENTCEPPDPTPGEQRHLAMFLPCESPVNRHMVSLQSRIESFAQWPAHHMRATAQEIAKAGFYYLGDSDKTKCFYCNGGLQNWEVNDEPWTEHAKWFPGCEFVLRQKGIDFVRRLWEAHPNLNRPTMRNPVDFFGVPSYQEERQTNKAGSSMLNYGYGRPPPNEEVHEPESKRRRKDDWAVNSQAGGMLMHFESCGEPAQNKATAFNTNGPENNPCHHEESRRNCRCRRRCVCVQHRQMDQLHSLNDHSADYSAMPGGPDVATVIAMGFPSDLISRVMRWRGGDRGYTTLQLVVDVQRLERVMQYGTAETRSSATTSNIPARTVRDRRSRKRDHA